MAESHIVKNLADKRKEIQAYIGSLEADLEQTRRDLSAIIATERVFPSPGINFVKDEGQKRWHVICKGRNRRQWLNRRAPKVAYIGWNPSYCRQHLILADPREAHTGEVDETVTRWHLISRAL